MKRIKCNGFVFCDIVYTFPPKEFKEDYVNTIRRNGIHLGEISKDILQVRCSDLDEAIKRAHHLLYFSNLSELFAKGGVK